ncbi:hypothetical protein ZWY2020_015726 [Hordeum vulgare]|nr:hypothetical protein ZWY2020_015726 [Hordeum vulgare]
MVDMPADAPSAAPFGETWWSRGNQGRHARTRRSRRHWISGISPARPPPSVGTGVRGNGRCGDSLAYVDGPLEGTKGGSSSTVEAGDAWWGGRTAVGRDGRAGGLRSDGGRRRQHGDGEMGGEVRQERSDTPMRPRRALILEWDYVLQDGWWR